MYRFINRRTYTIYRNIHNRGLPVPLCNSLGRLSVPAVTRNYAKECATSHGKVREWGANWRGVFARFVPVGLCLIAVMQWRNYRKYSTEQTAKQWEISCYCALPLRVVSRCWGWLADKNLPEPVRPVVYSLYSKTFGVNLAEAIDEDLRSYPSLADFFSRALKDGVRQIDPTSNLVSPCDGTVLHCGPVGTGHIEQVKGVTYSLENFLGENTWNKSNTGCEYHSSLLHSRESGTTLYQCVIYLAPGDYHRFHSPAEWQPTHRRHFPGQLLSVNPSIAKWLPGLFCLNERVVYLGKWNFGFFSMTAVGATNVGTVKVYFDKALQTNRPKYRHAYNSRDKCLGTTVSLTKGDAFGEFRMGSTIVLVFEAPVNFNFRIAPGHRVRMGECLGYLAKAKHVDKVQIDRSNVIINAS